MWTFEKRKAKNILTWIERRKEEITGREIRGGRGGGEWREQERQRRALESGNEEIIEVSPTRLWREARIILAVSTCWHKWRRDSHHSVRRRGFAHRLLQVEWLVQEGALPSDKKNIHLKIKDRWIDKYQRRFKGNYFNLMVILRHSPQRNCHITWKLIHLTSYSNSLSDPFMWSCNTFRGVKRNTFTNSVIFL